MKFVILINKKAFDAFESYNKSKNNAKVEAHVILFEPATTLNTGNIKNELTREQLKKI